MNLVLLFGSGVIVLSDSVFLAFNINIHIHVPVSPCEKICRDFSLQSDVNVSLTNHIRARVQEREIINAVYAC